MPSLARSPSRTPARTTARTTAQFSGPRFLARQLGILAFNRRVLAQAADRQVPLLERLRFLCIVSSNLDEFFEIQVAEMMEYAQMGWDFGHADESKPEEVLHEVSVQARVLVAEQYRLLNHDIFPALSREGIEFLAERDWSNEQRAWLHDYFRREMISVLTPIGLDPSHPFPRVLNKSLNFAVQLEGRDAFGRNSGTAIVQAPRVLPRIIQLPKRLAPEGIRLVLLTSVLQAFVGALFEGMEIIGSHPFRVTRNSDLFLDEEEIKDLRAALQGELPQRHYGDSVRLEIATGCPAELEQFLLRQFELTDADLYRVDGPVNLVRLMQVPEMIDLPQLKYRPFQASVPNHLEKAPDLFAAIRNGEILLHHPYQSFAPVIDFLDQAASDPDVVAIKQTVYRTGTDSVLMQYLIDAAKRGKEVTVVVELLARFDEEANLTWASKLEEVGAHVVYGVVGFKTHAKMLLVVRRESGRLKRYVHLSTGNYHPRTARLYTDFGLLTCDEEIGEDVSNVFKQLTGLGRARNLNRLLLAPFTLHDGLLEAIRREARHARSGKRAHIIAKMNSLVERGLIEALYAASRAGVKIDLIVRGMCTLRPGVPGLSENIRVTSIIGRFLEHSRIFYFLDDGGEQVMLSSADWMERNMFRRIEACIPIRDPKLKARVIREGLRIYLADNNAWEMRSDGSYLRRRNRTRARRAQMLLLSLLAPAK
ncbi:MAG: polyphosphate kinase 1 [Betaproteobacteria bacterium]|nr:polyphosphate kinase 1 [Betaproteobacteria bacterium]